MRTITLLLFSLSFLGPMSQSEVSAQRRGAIWVHGLNANNREWNNWSGQFTAQRQLNNRNRLISGGAWQNYDSRAGVNQMATNVLADEPQNGGGDAQTIYFGHSMGGVVGREIDANPNRTRNFGGIVTAGAPLDGARIANASRNGEASYAIFDGIDVVSRGPGRQLSLWGAFVVTTMQVADIVRVIESVWDIFNIRDLGNQGAGDLAEGSDYMNSGVRHTQTPIPKVLIYGNEDAPGCWRIASLALSENNTDEKFVGISRTAGDVYEAAMWVNYGLAAGYTIAAFFTFGATAWQAVFYAWVAVGWMDGMNWWRYDSDRIWNQLIGANINASSTLCYPQLDSQGLDQCLIAIGQGATYDDYIRCQQQNTYQACYTYYSSVNGQSDAFIKATSQSGYYSAWANNATRIEAQGVNHLEMDRHPRMGEIYNQIFDGAGVNGFFATP
jgi:pimeloyl-ACP methyl ester carboxylesterase